MRKLLLTFTAMLFCSIASFAQTEISTKEQFLAIEADGNYILTADINLGDLGERTASIIPTFSGTLDGNGKTITYQASFSSDQNNDNLGLFESVSGTIRNLNLDANITVSGNKSNVKVGLLCGELMKNNNSSTIIEFCNVTGNINSTVKPGTYGHSSTGLIVGSNLDTLQYCTAHGNVTGVGYAGGLVGSMGTLASGLDNNEKPLIRGCYFTGNVTAINSSTDAANALAAIINGISGLVGGATDMELQSFGGGICGTMRNPAKIELCVAEAIVVVGNNAGGITTTSFGATLLGWGSCGKAQSNYATGTINGTSIGSDNLVDKVISSTSNPAPNSSPNYPTNNVTNFDDIVGALEAKRGNDNNFYFEVINGKIVLVIGQRITHICEAPTGLTVRKEANETYTASWSVNDQDESVEETIFRYTLTNNGDTIQSGTTTNTPPSVTLGTLYAETTPYILTVESDCSTYGLYSDAISYKFYVDATCPLVTSLEVTNVNPTTVNVSWEGTADTIKLNGSVITLTNGGNYEGLTPGTEYTIEAIVNCTRHEGETVIIYPLSTIVTFVTAATDYVTAQSGNFNIASTWVGGKVPTGLAGTTITIREGHEVRLDGTLVLNGTIINKGVLVIPQQGQLINTTDDNVLGIIEIVSAQKENQTWTFIGAPFQNGYKLETIVPVPGNDADGISDISVKKYDYGTEENPTPGWSNSWAHIDTEMKAGEGYFGYPFYGGVVTFTTYGDVCTWDNENERYVIGSYNYNRTPLTVTELNNGDVTFDTAIAESNGSYWMALSNPYPAKLSVSKFLADNGSKLQGNCVYVFRNGTFDNGSISTGEIAMTEGFFVNFKANAEKKAVFNKAQLKDYPTSTQNPPAEFIELTLINGDKEVRAYLAHNEEAEQGYDIFDANKMFAPTEVTEPYFVTDGIALMKEEFAELPYYATMNVRSFADDTVSFVVENIPEGLSVSIIDGENIIDMVEGGVYTTEILTGENADRFKVLIKKSVSISDVEELEVNITNNNRHISIETTETDLQVEVYNALGQKVLSTKDRNFTLNQVSAGAYLIKAFNNKASKTQKIVVE